jgi:aminopeptidase YwaD
MGADRRRLALSTHELELRGRISGKRAVALVEELVAAGDRFVGQDGDQTAAEQLRRRFRELGLELVEREFTTLGYRHDLAELTLQDGSLIEAIPPYFSPSTPAGGVSGELVFAGGGEEADYEGLDVDEKIVVVQEVGLGYSRFWLGTFVAAAARRGARAMVVIHPLPWPYRMSMEAGNGDLSRRFVDEQLPVACISGVDGCRLMHAIGAGQGQAHLAVVSETSEVTSSNVSGVLAGGELPDECVVVHAHRDHGLHPGANDNGSGYGTMLEVAAALANERPRRSIEFLCTTAEEGTTPGIAAYIEARRSEGSLESVQAAIDLDMFGVGGKVKLVELGLWPDTEPIPHTEWLMRWLEEIADDLGYDVGRMTAPWGVAESGRFIEAGVPAVWFWKPDDFYYHSVHDSVDKLDGNSLKAVGDITAIGLWRLANAGELPTEV